MTATKLALDARRHNRDKLVAAYPKSTGAALAKHQAELTSDSVATPVVARQGSWIFQFRVLLERAFKYKLRDEQVAITQISFGIFFATVLGAVYYDTSKNVESVTNRIGAISFSVLLMAFIAFDVVILFPKERDMYRREARAGLHSASAFFHARCVAEIPAHLIAGLCYASISYYMMGFQAEPRKFLIFLTMIEMEIFTGTSVLISCGTLAKDFAGANNLATLFICIFMMFDGHYINNNELPPGAKWIKELNYLNHGISALARNEFTGLGDLKCDDDQDNCPFDNGGDVIDYYGYDSGSLASHFWKLALIATAWRAIAFLAFQNLHLD